RAVVAGGPIRTIRRLGNSQQSEDMMEMFIGQITLFPYTFAPEGWVPCDGRTLAIMENQALFSLLGTQFGGDGRESFMLPSIPPVESKGGIEVRYFIAVNVGYGCPTLVG